MGLRPEGSFLEGYWEFPGGKIETGENPDTALVRELREEIGIEATESKLKLAHGHSYGEKNVLLLFYEVKKWTGEVQKKWHEKLEWVTPEIMKDLPMPEANRRALHQLEEVIRGS